MKEEDKNKKIAVLYHKNCPDGFGAALAAYLKFGQKADYFPAQHQAALPEGLVDKEEIFTVDFCPGEEDLKMLMKNNKKVTVIDHHKSSESDTRLASEVFFDLDHSGAVLAWRYFHPKKKIPKLALYVEDQDLWRFKLPRIKELSAYLRVQLFDFKVWKRLLKDFDDNKRRAELVKEGAVILRHEEYIMNFVADHLAEEVEFEGHKILAVNFSYSPLSSHLAHILYERRPPMSIVWYEDQARRKFSIRSDGSVDVAKIAAKFGGGGHKAAAGFAMSKDEELPWKIN